MPRQHLLYNCWDKSQWIPSNSFWETCVHMCWGSYLMKLFFCTKFYLPPLGPEWSDLKNWTTCIDNSFYIISVLSLIDFYHTDPQKPVCTCWGSNFIKPIFCSKFNLPPRGSEWSNWKKWTTCIDNSFYIIFVPSLIEFYYTALQKPACTCVGGPTWWNQFLLKIQSSTRGLWVIWFKKSNVHWQHLINNCFC